ncbi:hypothetical protein ACFPM0_12550 [Pseudonocardia sulfidoxydans]|uniref:hypothetical protein n=1 Tax=Pseudonocardia sulfidoxydans TaxID=54011 RepID=UPI00360A7D35
MLVRAISCPASPGRRWRSTALIVLGLLLVASAVIGVELTHRTSPRGDGAMQTGPG